MERDAAPISAPDVYQRLFENKWVEGAGSFITRAQLEACIHPDCKPLVVGVGAVRYVATSDLGLKRDRMALAVGHLDRDHLAVVLD